MAKSTGEIAKTINIEVRKCGVKAAETIAKGDFVTWDTSNDLLKATAGTTTIVDGFGMALEASTAAVPANINVAVGNTYVYAEAGADIDAMDLVKLQDTQECEVMTAPSLAAGATPTTAEVDAIRDFVLFQVGRAFGKEGDTDDFSVASNGQTFVLRLGH